MAKKSYRIRVVDNNPVNDNINNVKEEKKYDNRDFTRHIHIIILSMFLSAVAAVSSTYAIYGTTHKIDDDYSMEVGTLKVDFVDQSSSKITLNSLHAKSDDEGLKQDPVKFFVANKGNSDVVYRIRLVDDLKAIENDGCKDNLINLEDIRININNQKTFTLNEASKKNFTISENVVEKGQSKGYSIKVWVANNKSNNKTIKHYHGKIVVDVVSLNSVK